jgi:MFS family permease
MRGLLPPITLTLVSAASMALEIVAGRALAPYVGMSLYTWTMVIAIVLAGLSVGHAVGGVVTDRSRDPARAVGLVLLGAAVTAALCLGALRAVEPLAATQDPMSHIGVLAFAAFFLPSLLAGMVSPLLTSLALDAQPPERRGRVLGMMFALGAAGAIGGTLLAGLLLISWLGTALSTVVIAALYGLLSLAFLAGAMRWAALVAAAATAGAVYLLNSLPGYAGGCLVESSYYCIRTDDLSVVGRPVRVMALDHLAHGLNDRDDPKLLYSFYAHGADELVRERFPGDGISAFFIGGGAYTIPRAWLAQYPDARIQVAEVDPAVTAVARSHLWLADDPRLTVHHRDARTAMRNLPAGERFDVIFGDAFHDISVPPHLVTNEFHQTVRARLSDRGVYLLNIVDLQRAPRFALSVAQTLQRQFAAVELWMDVDEIAPQEKRTTWIVLASQTQSPGPEITSTYGAYRTWVRVPLQAMIDVVSRDKLVFLTDDYAPVDRLLSSMLLNADNLEQ